jgi:hypothetical protein
MLKLSAPPIRGLLVVAALCPALSAGARSTEVNVIVDFTPEGRKVAHPNPGNPAYYYPVMGSFEELGAGEAGEKAPKQWDVAHVAALELAKQGYLKMNPTPYVNAAGQVTYRDGTVVMVPANPIPGRPLALNAPGNIPLTRAMLEAPDGAYSLKAARTASAPRAESPLPATAVLQATDPIHGPVMSGMPNLILSFQYGYANPESASFDGTTNDPIKNIYFNQRQMYGLVTGNTLKNLDLDIDREAAMERAGQDRYFVMVSAYDFEAYRTSRKVVLLWQAKMSAPSDSLAQFTDALNALVWAGGPYFGRETARPATVVLPVTPDGRVDIGTPEVKNYSESPPPSPSGPAAAAK